MKNASSAIIAFAITIFIAHYAQAQALEICSRASGAPSFGEAWGAVPYIFGKVNLVDNEQKLSKVTVGYSERGRPEQRVILDKTGNYCFRRTSSESAATIVIYLDSTEVGRRQISDLGASQQREDFDVRAHPGDGPIAPGTVSAKYPYPPNAKTTELYRKAVEAEKENDQAALLEYLRKIVETDPSDFIAWGKLGSVLLTKRSYLEAEQAFQKAIALRADFLPAMINLARVYLAQVKSSEAIAAAQKAVGIDPKSPRAYQILGNAYLQAKKGSLGVEALEKALDLDPIGMSDSHLLLATLYDRAGAKDLASREYRLFLEKVKEHPDRKKFEKYVKENPETAARN